MILYTQWKWSRLALLLTVLAAFALPVLSVQGVTQGDVSRWEVREMLVHFQSYGVAYPLLAAAVALLMGLTAWGPDHRGRHVYALSLPVPRWHYALLRFGA